MAEDTYSDGRLQLAGRRIIVTGAASGIGRAIAEVFWREGARLALMDRDAAGLADVARNCAAHSIAFDLADAPRIAPSVEQAATHLEGLDGLVNCAGVSDGTPIGAVDLALLSRVIAINLTAPYLLCAAALPHLQKSEHATIVNIASGVGLLPNAPNTTAYAATKGGLIAFTKALAAEAAPRIRANVICPGMVNTPMTAPIFAGYANPSDAPVAERYALRRVAEPGEIAQAALFLSGSASSYITGVALAVDGGRTFH